MKYAIFREPFTHIVIDDFLPNEVHSYCIKSIPKYNPYLKDGIVGVPKTGFSVDQTLKKNKNLWLFKHHQQYPGFTDIPDLLNAAIWTDEMQSMFMATGDSLFQTLLYTNMSNTLLSKYSEGDSYNWHRDHNQSVTLNYMLSPDASKFQGGEFVLGTWSEKIPAKVIEFKNNRLLAFPARAYHKVNPVFNCTGTSNEVRYTLQYWSTLDDRIEQD